VSNSVYSLFVLNGKVTLIRLHRNPPAALDQMSSSVNKTPSDLKKWVRSKRCGTWWHNAVELVLKWCLLVWEGALCCSLHFEKITVLEESGNSVFVNAMFFISGRIVGAAFPQGTPCLSCALPVSVTQKFEW